MSDDPRGDERRVYEPEVAEASAGERREFDWRGWVLVGLVVFAFVVAPAIIILYPPERLPFLVSFFALPLVPAVLLGIVAVWATTRP